MKNSKSINFKDLAPCLNYLGDKDGVHKTLIVGYVTEDNELFIGTNGDATLDNHLQMVVKCSKKSLETFARGKVDLRTLFMNNRLNFALIDIRTGHEDTEYKLGDGTSSIDKYIEPDIKVSPIADTLNKVIKAKIELKSMTVYSFMEVKQVDSVVYSILKLAETEQYEQQVKDILDNYYNDVNNASLDWLDSKISKTDDFNNGNIDINTDLETFK